MSRLEAGGLVPQPRAFPLAEVLEPLASEFRALAAERGLAFRYVAHVAPGRTPIRNCCAGCCRTSSPTPCATPSAAASLLGVRRDGDGAAHRSARHRSGHRRRPAGGDLRGVPSWRRRAAGRGWAWVCRSPSASRNCCDAPLRLRSQLGRGTVFAVTRAAARRSRGAAVDRRRRARHCARECWLVDNDPQAMSRVDGRAAKAGAAKWSPRDDCDGAPRRRWSAQPAVALAVRLPPRRRRHRRRVARTPVQRFGACPTVILSADQGEAVRRAVHEAGLSLLLKPVKPLALKSVLDRLLAARGAELSRTHSVSASVKSALEVQPRCL